MDKQFLPVSKKEIKLRGWEAPDFIIVTGDAYVDHHSFGAALIGRVLESKGYKVAIIAQPYFQDTRDIEKLGKPRLAFLVTAGNMDSMVNHYSVSKNRRKKDSYSPGGRGGKRPDRATIVYSRLVREAFNDIPIIIGGLEASLRRFAHYDYWDDLVKPSILGESTADLLVYGMGERTIVEIGEALNNGFQAKEITWLAGTCYMAEQAPGEAVVLDPFESVRKNTKAYADSFYLQYREQDAVRGKILAQQHGDRFLVQNPPADPLPREELDEVYGLPFMREYHPSYQGQGGIPALQEVKHSIISSRGCFGECSFCAITFHQGRVVTSRSKDSIVREAEEIIEDQEFKGYIHDVGGPTANFRHSACKKQLTKGTCPDKRCLFPEPCKNLEIDHLEYLDILRTLRKLKGIKKVFIRSGIRYDYVMADKNDTFLKEISKHHISGQLKVAPEHISPRVLKVMGKPDFKVYEAFKKKYEKINSQLGQKQYLVPYLISSHPGSSLEDAIMLAEYLRDINYKPEQVQDFYPVPGTLSTAMWHTGIDPRNGEKVYIPKSEEEKAMQRALLQYYNKDNWDLVRKALLKAGRRDLIGFGRKCLVPPKEMRKESAGKGKEKNKGMTQGKIKDSKDAKVIKGIKSINKGNSKSIKEKVKRKK